MKKLNECKEGDMICEISSVHNLEPKISYYEVTHVISDMIYLGDICFDPALQNNNYYFCKLNSKLYMPVENLPCVMGIYKMGVEHGMGDVKKQMRLLLDIKD